MPNLGTLPPRGINLLKNGQICERMSSQRREEHARNISFSAQIALAWEFMGGGELVKIVGTVEKLNL